MKGVRVLGSPLATGVVCSGWNRKSTEWTKSEFGAAQLLDAIVVHAIQREANYHFSFRSLTGWNRNSSLPGLQTRELSATPDRQQKESHSDTRNSPACHRLRGPRLHPPKSVER